MPESDDLVRLRQEYAGRETRLAGSRLYSFLNPAHLFMIQSRARAVLAMLARHGVTDLKDRRILELGCGRGGVLLEYQAWGAAPERLFGIDLLFDRVRDAHQASSKYPLACANGENLPYPRGSFDIVLQYTAFSSVLEDGVKQNLAREMVRVLRAGGIILWYDFWLNPTNRQTRGIRPGEVRRLFPGCACDFKKITLAPPIARRIVPVSWFLASFLENLGFLNTHYVAAIWPVHSAGELS